MPAPVSDVNAAFNPVRLHRLMGGFLTALAGIYLCITYLGRSATPPVTTGTSLIVYAPSAVGAVLVVIGLLILKPRAPARTPDQTIEDYWSMPQVRQTVPLFWFALEGGGLLSAVGYYLTGAPVPMILMGLAVATFWLCGPHTFTKA
jgi:hypothetical protein